MTPADRRLSSLPALTAGAAVLALALAACGGSTIQSASGPKSSAGKCGTVNLAVNPWVGYEADAAVYSYVAKTDLGCTVKEKNITEQVSWQGFGSGEVDAILENWGHEDLKQKYITDQKTATEIGPLGVNGIIGWYVPPWMAKKYPDITDWKNLNKYASLFKTSESGGKGQVLDGDPSYVTNDEALVKNLKLNYKVVKSGSEAALITSFRTAEAKKKPLLAYFYQPQWFFSEMQLVKINLPKYTTGCDAKASAVACDYPPYTLDKIASTKFVNSGSPAMNLLKNFAWTNEDQNVVAKYIAEDKMSDDAAAKKWVDANPDKVKTWLGQ